MTTTETLQIMPDKCTAADKKCFSSQGDAMVFEIDGRRRHGWTQQYPYLCEHCGFYHLSTKQAGDLRRAQVNWEDAEKYNTRAEKMTPEEKVEAYRKIMEMTQHGKTGAEIAKELDISVQTVYNLRNGKLGTKAAATLQGVEVEQDSLEQQIARLQQKLQENQAKKQAIIDAQEVRVMWSTDNPNIMVITQNEHRFPLLPEDARKLMGLLQQRLEKK